MHGLHGQIPILEPRVNQWLQSAMLRYVVIRSGTTYALRRYRQLLIKPGV